MDTREEQRTPDAGLLGCDREVFAQVWGRVRPQGDGPVEPAAEPGPCQGEGETAPAPMVPAELGGTAGQSGRRLQGLTLDCLTDAAAYRDLARRTRRAVSGLQALAQRKTHQAKRLSTAYFLLTGVRYWPKEVTPVEPPEPFFPALRQRFLTEGRRRETLDRLARETEEPNLRELYLDLALETGEMVRAVRTIVERET